MSDYRIERCTSVEIEASAKDLAEAWVCVMRALDGMPEGGRPMITIVPRFPSCADGLFVRVSWVEDETVTSTDGSPA